MTNESTTTGGRLVPAVEYAGRAESTGPDPTGATAPNPGRLAQRGRGERGMVSAEWAVGIIAAIAVAGVLLAVITSGPVQDVLLKFILSVINHFSDGFARR